MDVNFKTFNAVVEEVHSGDDLILLVDLGVDGLHKRVRARLKGVDTPSAFRAAKSTEAGQIRDMIRNLVSAGKCSIKLHAEGKGGWLVSLFVGSGDTVTCVNEELISKGYVYQPKREAG